MDYLDEKVVILVYYQAFMRVPPKYLFENRINKQQEKRDVEKFFYRFWQALSV